MGVYFIFQRPNPPPTLIQYLNLELQSVSFVVKLLDKRWAYLEEGMGEVRWVELINLVSKIALGLS